MPWMPMFTSGPTVPVVEPDVARDQNVVAPVHAPACR